MFYISTIKFCGDLATSQLYCKSYTMKEHGAILFLGKTHDMIVKTHDFFKGPKVLLCLYNITN